MRAEITLAEIRAVGRRHLATRHAFRKDAPCFSVHIGRGRVGVRLAGSEETIDVVGRHGAASGIGCCLRRAGYHGARSLHSSAHRRSRYRCRDDRNDERCDGPGDEAVCGISKKDLVRVSSGPFGPQAAGEVSPIPEDSHRITTNQIAVMIVKPVADRPSRGQGEAEASPRPDPIAMRISVVAMAANAPAMIAAHDTAETRDSTVGSSTPRSGRLSAVTLFMAPLD